MSKPLTKKAARRISAERDEAQALLREAKLHFLAMQLHCDIGGFEDVVKLRGRLRAVLVLLGLNPPQAETFVKVRTCLDGLAVHIGLKYERVQNASN